MAFCNHAPLQVWRTSSSNSTGKLWIPIWRGDSFPSFSGGCGFNGFAGLFCWELSLIWIPIRDRSGLPSVSLSSSTTRCHLLDFPPSLCTDIGLCLSLVHSASPAIFPPVCSCALLLPSDFSRWSLVWFRYPVAFTRWCFGCSRGKQVSILCFYYFPD